MNKMKKVNYERKINFYETDAQGVVHHSNYPRYFEEVRGEFLEKIGLPYHIVRDKLKTDIVLLELHINYKKPIKFGELIKIEAEIKVQNKYFFEFKYKIFNSNNELKTEGLTKHCCINMETGKIVSIPKKILEKIEG
jgi:acyl-CoA thioester hydrolase